MIVSVRKFTAHFVVLDGSDYCKRYTRYSPDSWTVQMGASDEQVYDCKNLEAEFQAFKPKKKTKK